MNSENATPDRPLHATVLTRDRILGDEIRDELDLEYLEMPWAAAAVHPAFTLSVVENGYRTLRRVDRRPVAAARCEYEVGSAEVTLAKLVPLSHLLGFDLPTLKRAFLHPTGAPILVDGAYRDIYVRSQS